MPISDEVIELAPVKKTKKTLIIMIAGMGALLALAVAFLIMYLLKPSVTEDTNHVKDITLVSTELFSETKDGQVTYYASIGNEYTVYSTLTVDNNSSTNVSWDCDDSLIEVKERQNTGEAYLKFVPRVGAHGKTAKITVRASSQSSEFKTIEFVIVNQGAEDIQVTQYGVRTNLTNVKDDNINNDLSITVPYYTMDKTENNNPIQVKFNQLSKYNPTTGEYLKPTSVLLDGKKTDSVTVTSSEPSIISIYEDTVTGEGFSFEAKQSSNNKYVTISITANVHNADFDEITKTIKVKVEDNVALGYVDSMYVFNKPVVDADLMSKVVKSGDVSVVDSAKLKTEIEKDKTLKVTAYNDRTIKLISTNSDFALVLPYSSSSESYNDLFRHLLLNPAKIQYDGEQISTAWYKDIEVKSSDDKVLQVNTNSTTGEVRLFPKNVSGVSGGDAVCYLTIRDKKTGSAGASIKVPVRIVAQTFDVVLACEKNETKADQPQISVDAAKNGHYDVSVTYTFIATNRDNAATLLSDGCIADKYKLDFVGGEKNANSEIEVTLKGETKKLEPNTEYSLKDAKDFTFTKSGNGSNTKYTATITFTVTVKKDTDGDAVFKFIKTGSYLYGSDDGLKSKDKGYELSAAFGIKESAEHAWIIKDDDVKDESGNNKGFETALNIVTENGTKAGNFVREATGTTASIYVQNRASGELSIVTQENVHQFVRADKSHFKIANFASTLKNSTVLSQDRKTNTFSFTGESATSNEEVGSVTFDVLNVGNGKIATLTIRIFLIDAVTSIIPAESKPSVSYNGSTVSGSVKFDSSDVKIVRYYDTAQRDYDKYTDVNLYYGSDLPFAKVSNSDGYTFSYENKALYKYDARLRTLSTLTDIYAYSYEKNINFGNVEIEFLLGGSEEYIGKHFDESFVYAKDKRMRLEFVRAADGAALFQDDSYSTEVTRTGDGFAVSVNQDSDASLYATSIINITTSGGDQTVYVEKDAKGHVSPVHRVEFRLPAGITPSTSSTSGRYSSVNYHAPQISKESDVYSGGIVYYRTTSTGNPPVISEVTDTLKFTVNNATRTIKSIGIYSDSSCASDKSLDGKSLLFGGFINEANKYSGFVYIKVEYDTHKASFTSFEGAELTLPSYLKLDGKDAVTDSNGNNVYTLVPAGEYDSNKGTETFTCKLVLDSTKAVTDIKNIQVVPANNKTSNKSVSCIADVQAGLRTLTVKNGNATVATVTAGNKGKYATSFNLANRADVKSLTLAFAYVATNTEGYSLAYNHTGAGLKVTAPTTANGFALTDNIKSAQSSFTVAVSPDNAVAGKQTLTLTFTDEYNGANANNVFTLEIEITVTIDIYALAFAEDTNTAVTVTGESGGTQTLTVSVVYNDGITSAQPETALVKAKNVLGVYVFDGTDYTAVTNVITVTRAASDASGKTFTVSIANNIDRTQKYYLRLVYDNVTYVEANHRLELTINTLTSHIVLDGGNSVKPEQVQGEPCPTASIIITSASDEFTLVANVVNDGSGSVESGKTVTYGLFTDFNCTTANRATGFTIDNGVIQATNPSAVNGTLYYLAEYTEQKTGQKYQIKVKLTYTVAPSAVAISGVDSKAFDSASKTLTLYFGSATSYTQADLSGKIGATTAFSGASYTSENVQYNIALQNTSDNSYLDINGRVLKPKAAAVGGTTVPVIVTATYAGETVQNVYNVRILPIAKLSLAQSSGTLNLLNKNSALSVTPTFDSYNGFTAAYTLTAGTDILSITGSGNEKTVKLVYNSNTKLGKYNLTANLSYTYAAGAGISAIGTFASTESYEVTVSGTYDLAFNLMETDVISPYDGTENTKYPIVDTTAAYTINVTSNDADFDVVYSATRTAAVVSIADFSGKTAAVTLNTNASGAFAITVTATVGGEKFTKTKNYYFMYGVNPAVKMYVSSDGGNNFSAFNQAAMDIDYTATPYKFKYEISGLSGDAVVNLVVNGDVETSSQMIESNGNRTWIITVKKPTTIRIGAAVKLGTRWVYLEDKTVTLTATAPDFILESNSSDDTVLPAGTLGMSVKNNANGFLGTYTVAYSVVSGDAYATIDATSGALTAEKNVVTDQTVIVRATVEVSDGVYQGTYTIDKAVTVTGVALPTVKWKNNVNKELCLKDKYNFTYGTGSYTLSDNGSYSYEDKVTTTITAASGTLTLGTDFTFVSGTLTLVNTEKTRAGGSLRLIVTTVINSGAHNGESVSDTITVRVLPVMNESANGITIGNAATAYDFNIDRFKSIFAPAYTSGSGFVHSADKYAIVALSVDDTVNFDVDGAKLIVNSNLTSAIQAQVTATVLISSGEYAGTTVVGTKTITVEVPASSLTENVQWNNADKYNDITLNQAKVLGNDISGTVSGITVVTSDSVSEYVTVASNGTVNPVVSVSKNFGAYFTADAPDKSFAVNYIVTLVNGNVYYSDATYNVDPIKVNITATLSGEALSGNSASIDSGETAIMQLSADKGFEVVVAGVSASNLVTATYGGNGIQFTAKTVTSDQNVQVTLNLKITGLDATYTFNLNISAPVTGAQYSASNTDNIDFAVDDGHIVGQSQNNVVVSTWEAIGNVQYKRGISLEITAPSGHNLSEYFANLSLKDTRHSARTPSSLEANKVTIDFHDDYWREGHDTTTFTLTMTFNTSNTIPLSTIQVKYTAGRSGSMNSNDTIVLYRVQVTGTIPVTLNTNAGSDAVQMVTYNSPLYKHSYGLPTPTRTGYTFTGWYTAATGGSMVASDAKVTDVQPHTLYAQWTAKTYTLKYNANYTGATAISDTKTVTYGQTYGELTVPTRAGYDFIAWTATNEANSQVITADTLVNPANANTVTEITLFAQWRIQYYTVTLNAGEGTLDGTNNRITVQVSYGGSFSLHNLITPTRDGYRFNGWNASGDTSNITGDVTLTAQWVQLYTVSFVANADGVTNPQSVQMANGDTYALPTLTRDGYRFKGWYNGANKVESGNAASLSANITLSAQWVKLYTVNFVNNESDETPDEQQYDEGAEYNLPTLQDTNTKHFDGWSLAENGVLLAGGATVSGDDAQITLYAVWSDKTSEEIGD